MYTLSSFSSPFTRSLFNVMNDFDDMLTSSAVTSISCKTDIRECEGKYIVDAELPGFDKSDITLDINGDCLTIKAKRTVKTEEKNEKNTYILKERSNCSYERSFDISEIDIDSIKANYKNGILTIELPKKAEVKPQARQIEIS